MFTDVIVGYGFVCIVSVSQLCLLGSEKIQRNSKYPHVLYFM